MAGPMTSALPEVLEKLEPCPFCGGEPKFTEVGSDLSKSRKLTIQCKGCRFKLTNAAMRHGFDWLYEITIAAWNTRHQPALLRDAGDGDSARLDFIERTFRGMSNGERYLPLVMGWGKSRNGRTLREAIDKYMEKEGPLTGVTFVERDMPPGVVAELRTPNDRVTIVDDDAAMHAPGGAGGG